MVEASIMCFSFYLHPIHWFVILTMFYYYIIYQGISTVLIICWLQRMSVEYHLQRIPHMTISKKETLDFSWVSIHT